MNRDIPGLPNSPHSATQSKEDFLPQECFIFVEPKPNEVYRSATAIKPIHTFVEDRL